MRLKSLSLMLFIVFTISAVVIAQPRSGDRGESRAEAQLKRIKEKVQLTDSQAVKVKAIMQKAREEARAEFENSDGDRDAMRENMMKRMEKTDAEILKLLTKEQKPKYEEYKKERQKEMEERMRERQ
jgi:Spy/CpxP family protein refolding chaperone